MTGCNFLVIPVGDEAKRDVFKVKIEILDDTTEKLFREVWFRYLIIGSVTSL